MPKRNRTNEQRKQHGVHVVVPPPTATGAPPNKPIAARPVDDEVTRAAKMFADSVRAHEAADQAERDRVRAETEQMLHHESLRANKQRAADLIKQLRGQAGSRQRMVEAEANYRAALAELQEFETGERPHWAPAVEAPAVNEIAEGSESVDADIPIDTVSFPE